MTNIKVQIKIKQRANKLSSNDYDNFEPWMIEEAMNKAQLEWCRRQLHGGNQYREGAEQSVRRVDDLEPLLKPYPLTGITGKVYFESVDIPKDYFQFNKVIVSGNKGPCKAERIIAFQTEEANVEVLLRDENYKPSFEWRETFCTLVGSKVRVYTNDAFTINEATLLYYRLPREIKFINSVDISTGLVHTKDQECEFKDDITELIIDLAASILTGDIESQQTQRLAGLAEQNN